MRITVRTLLGAASLAAGALTLAGCGRETIVAATSASSCPAAAFSLGVSRSVAPSGIAASTNGCAHRAPIEIPLAQVIDLNDNAQVLGILNATGPAQLVVWSKSGIVTLTTPPGASSATGVDLNDNGVAVGCGLYPPTTTDGGGGGGGGTPTSVRASRAVNDVPVCHVVVWTAQGVPTDLGLIDPAAHEAIATAINDAGTIVGTLVYATGQRAFVRTADGVVTYIDTPGTRSAAVALNEQGEVAGWYTNGAAAFGPWTAFTWTAAGGRVDIPALPAGSADAQSSMKPLAINETGEVLGALYAYHPATPGTLDRRSTFLYSRAGGVIDVGPTSGFSDAVALNDQGEILGWATLDGMTQPASWATTRPSLLAVRYGWQPGEGNGTVYQINDWNEVLDSYVQGGVTHNVVWTWNPERYR